MVKNILNQVKYWIFPSESNGYKSKILQSRFLLYFVVLLFVFRIISAVIFFDLPQNVFFADITKGAIQNMVNQTRESLGLNPLSESNKLNQAAELKAQNMVENNYFSHTSPSGISPWFWFVKAGYDYKYAGENLAVGFFESKEVYNAWLNSPSHKANIVNPNYTEMGIAVLKGYGYDDSVIVVQEFGRPKTVVVPARNITKTVKNTQPAQTTTNITENPISTDKPVEETVVNQNIEQVLSQTSQKTPLIETPDNKEKVNNLYSKVANSLIYEHDGVIEKIVFGLSLIVMGIMMTLIMFNFRFNFNRALVFRSVLIIILLSASILVNKENIIALVPHQIYI